jgi:hypothetical protein
MEYKVILMRNQNSEWLFCSYTIFLVILRFFYNKYSVNIL